MTPYDDSWRNFAQTGDIEAYLRYKKYTEVKSKDSENEANESTWVSTTGI